jgi:hypothetical protein
VKDDAVAPVIAVMLILAAIVTFLTIWNAVYIPSMKQAAEVGHLQNVEAAFLHFSSDIGRAVPSRQNMTLSEPVQLGGGDVFFNTLRSGGSLSVQDEARPVYYLWLDDDTDPSTVLVEMDGTLVNISYEPVGNFWQDMGYRWQYGFLNVTKHRIRQTPLAYTDMAGVSAGFDGSGPLAVFAGGFGDADHTMNQTFFQNATPTPENRFTFSPRGGNCSRIVLWAVNMSASPGRRFVSSNGFGTLEVKTRVVSVPLDDVRNISIGAGREPFGNATFRAWNASLSSIAGDCSSNFAYAPAGSFEDFSMYTIRQDVTPVNVTLNVVTLEVAAY